MNQNESESESEMRRDFRALAISHSRTWRTIATLVIIARAGVIAMMMIVVVVVLSLEGKC